MKKTKKGGVLPPAAELTDALQKNQVAGAPTEPTKKKPQRVETIRVRHDFDDKELLAIGGTLADKQRVYDHTESELKTIQRQFKTTMSGLKCDIDSAVDKIKDGYEMREVESVVMIRVDKKAKTATKVFYRKDDGSFIKDEPAINTELELFNVLPDKRDHTKPLARELLDSQV